MYIYMCSTDSSTDDEDYGLFSLFMLPRKARVRRKAAREKHRVRATPRTCVRTHMRAHTHTHLPTRATGRA